MKKNTLLFIMIFLLCVMGVSSVYSAKLDSAKKSKFNNPGTVSQDDSTKDVEAKDVASTETKDEVKKDQEEEDKDKDKDKDKDEEENKGLATLPNGTAYVGVYSYLNIRDGVWGSIIGRLEDNDEVTISGRDGDWYTISSPTEGYVHARYIFDSKNKKYLGDDPSDPSGSSSSSSGSTDVVINVDGSTVQGKVVNAAKQIHDKYQGYQAFPYDPLTEGGNLGCAQVATTVLKAAGVLNSTCLNCTGTISMLEAVGWKSVSWPPYQAGDVVFWETYLPGPSHVGIVMNSGNSAQAMNNSSSKRMPVYSDITSMKICKIMRKC